MTYEEFREKLAIYGFTNKSFAEKMEISESALTKWKKNSIPKWVDEYFLLIEENRDLQDLQEAINKYCSHRKDRDGLTVLLSK